MKNFKKLFVVLPLVLVMLLTALPVFADDDKVLVDQGKYGNVIFNSALNQIGFSKDDEAYMLSQSSEKFPVWLGTLAPLYEGDEDYVINAGDFGKLRVNMLNNGAVHGWVEFNFAVVGPLTAAQQYVAANAPGYAIPSYQILNVFKVDKKVLVPETWLQKKYQPTGPVQADVADYTEIVADKVVNVTNKDGSISYLESTKDFVFAETVYYFKAGEAQLADLQKVNAVITHIDGTKATVTLNGQTVDATYAASAYTLAAPIVAYNIGDAVPQGDKADFNAVADKKVEPKDANKFANQASFIVKPVMVPETSIETKVVTHTKKVDVVDKNGNVATERKADGRKLVEAVIPGYIIIVEKTDYPVEVVHHFLMADGTELKQTVNQSWAKANGILGVTNVDPEWYMSVKGFEIQLDKTEVTAMYNDQSLTLGEKFLESYKVDLYYMAGEANPDAEKEIDAAFAGNQAGVQNDSNVNNAAQLPATGAADNFFVVLSSVAMVVIGLFLKK